MEQKYIYALLFIVGAIIAYMGGRSRSRVAGLLLIIFGAFVMGYSVVQMIYYQNLNK